MLFWIWLGLLVVVPILVGVLTHDHENSIGTLFTMLIFGFLGIMITFGIVSGDTEVSRETKSLSKLTNTKGEEGYAFTKISEGGATTYFKDENGYRDGFVTVVEKEGVTTGSVETVTYIKDYKWVFPWDGGTSYKSTLTIPVGSLGGM